MFIAIGNVYLNSPSSSPSVGILIMQCQIIFIPPLISGFQQLFFGLPHSHACHLLMASFLVRCQMMQYTLNTTSEECNC